MTREGEQEEMPGETRKLRLQAEGITCSGCAEDMERLLLEEEGIVEASVDYGQGVVSVTYDADLTDSDQVFERVRRLGFPVKIAGDD